MRPLRAPLAALLIVVPLAAGAAGLTLPARDWFVEQIRLLASPALEGRASGTPGADRAAEHVARVFREAGLRPAGDAGTFRQAFSVPTGIRLGPDNALTLVAPARGPLVLGRDFVPLAASSDGDVTGDVVFAGYGITAPDLGYDDYAGLDVRGKVALAMLGEPRGRDPASPFRRPEAYHYSERTHKILNAREHGARAILLVAPPATAASLRLPSGTGAASGIVALDVSAAVADTLLGAAGTTLADAAAAIDAALTPRSRATGARVRAAVTLVREHGTAVNVVGVLAGTDPARSGDAIVVGAHYDHLGRGGETSLAPDRLGEVHAGADDNASGTTAVMALARGFAAAGGLPRTVVFVAFAGEEMGLLGSTHYVRHPAVPLDRTVLMVNFDMVGRLRDGRLHVSGVDTGAGLRQVVSEVAKGARLTVVLRGDPYAASDHTAFYTAGRPALFLFTGAHEDYHRPSDTWDKINGEGLVAVTEFAARVVERVARSATLFPYVAVTAPAESRRSGGGYGPFFGVVPEFGAAPTPGVRVSGVRAGSPAEKAGVRAGDVIVRFAGTAVKTIEDFTFVLRSKRAGDRVDVVVQRAGAEIPLEAVLEVRH